MVHSTIRFAMLIVLAAGIAGCGQSATLHIDAETQGRHYVYDIDRDGTLRITNGAPADGEHEEEYYKMHLGPEEMQRLTKTVQDSKFLLDFRSRVGTVGDARLTIEAGMGLMRNTLIVESAYVKSVGQIIAEMNSNLPRKYRLPYEESMFAQPGEGESPRPNDRWKKDVDEDMQQFAH